MWKVLSKVLTLACLLIWTVEFIRYAFTDYQSDSFTIGLAMLVVITYFIGDLFKGKEASVTLEVKDKVNT